jgi:hypothetical protein
MLAYRWVRRFLVGMAIVSLFGACSSSAASSPPVATPAEVVSTPSATVSPMPKPTSVATAAVAPTAVSYGPVSVVTGVEDCSIDFGTITGQGTTVQHARNGSDVCTDTVDDPRVNGTYTATWDMDYWGAPDHSNGALVQWGTARLTVAGGSWEGRATGVYSSNRGDTITWWWTGTGGYAGLTYFELVTGTGGWTVRGQIFPGVPPQP